MPLAFRDSLTERPATLPIPSGGPVRMYVCGPTVYDRAHVGHGRTYLFFDLIRRYLRDRGIPVRHVMNVTDFEDKISQRAKELGVTWRRLASAVWQGVNADLCEFGILPPHATPRASDFVTEMIQAVRHLEKLGHVRKDNGAVYYSPEHQHDPRNFPVGADLARHAVPEPGHPFNGREVSREFVLWQPQKEPNPEWSSPWGSGMPGWHIECFVMARHYLGLPVDLHGGGIDLIFPHHYMENELALTVVGDLFSRRYLHAAFVTENRAKMSKSTGNLVPLHDAVCEYGRDALRLYLMSAPFWSRLEWSKSEIALSCRAVDELKRRCIGSVGNGAGGDLRLADLIGFTEGIRHSLEKGLSTDRVIEHLDNWSARLGRSRNSRFARGERVAATRLYARVGQLLGIDLLQRDRQH